MDKIALVTGGSKGIGRALAEEFAKNGYSLILIARNLQQLQQAQQEIQSKYKVEIKVLSADLEKRESIELIVDTFKEELKNIEVLINNAGFGGAGKFTDMAVEAIDGMMAVNMVTLVDLTYKILPFMVAKKSGKIINLSSTAAFTPGPYMAIYYASKAFVYSFSMAIADEFQNDGIMISTLCPGLTESEFIDRAGMRNLLLLKSMKPMTTAEVAKIAYEGLMKNKKLIVPGMMNKMSAVSMDFIPKKLKTYITGILNRPKEK